MAGVIADHAEGRVAAALLWRGVMKKYIFKTACRRGEKYRCRRQHFYDMSAAIDAFLNDASFPAMPARQHCR